MLGKVQKEKPLGWWPGGQNLSLDMEEGRGLGRMSWPGSAEYSLEHQVGLAGGAVRHNVGLEEPL